MEQLKFCRVCLVTDVRMYNLDKPNDTIGVIYSQILQRRLCDNYQHVCFECGSLLHKYHIFKSKCLRAHEILSNISASSIITKETLKNVDKGKTKLESNLKLSATKICHIPSDDVMNKKIFEDNIIQSDPLQVPLLSVEATSPKSEYEEDVKPETIKIEVHINEESNATTENTELNENYFKEISEIPVHYESTEIKLDEINCEIQIMETTTSDLINTSTENVSENFDIIRQNLIIAPKIPATDNCKTSIIKNSKTVKRKMKTERSVRSAYKKCVPEATDVNDKRVKTTSEFNEEFKDYGTVVSLTTDDARKELLTRKDSRNYKRSPFKCDFCYKGYEKTSAFENHMRRHSVDNGKYECEICHLKFLNTRFLSSHLIGCHKRKFSCNRCPYICYCMSQAKIHVMLHKGKQYTCEECGKIFTMPHTLATHKRLKHLNVCMSENVCELCGDVFGPKGIVQHLGKTHKRDLNTKEGPKCEECDAHFASELAWKRHLVLSTKHTVVNGCKFCGDSFSSEDDLKTHIQTNHPPLSHSKYAIELPNECPLCKEWLSDQTEYRNHMTIDHSKSTEAMKFLPQRQRSLPGNASSYMCEVCGKAFKQQSLLTYHQRKHTGERPYKCDDCDKTFTVLATLKVHRNKIHTHQFQYQCDVCGRAFSYKATLRKHVKVVHLGIRPYKCPLCDKAFLHMCDVRAHIKYSHDKVPWPKSKKRQNKNKDGAQTNRKMKQE